MRRSTRLSNDIEFRLLRLLRLLKLSLDTSVANQLPRNQYPGDDYDLVNDVSFGKI